jgi:hypothetical protein
MNQYTGSSYDPPFESLADEDAAPPRRLFLFERGWKVCVKCDSQREFCYMMAPGQEYYHRLLDGELFLARDDEKLCLECAMRRGLITLEPKRLREAVVPLSADMEAIPLELDWRGEHQAN